MYKQFFPSVEFAWGFLLVLGSLLVIAAVVDWQRTVIPKWLTLSLLAFGVVLSVARGALLGDQQADLWIFSSGSVWLGGLDGFLFALIGFFSGFFLIFFLWALGTCGGGDVKLFAALGAWLGPVLVFLVFVGSLFVLFIEVFIKFLTLSFSPMAMRQFAEQARTQKPSRGKKPASAGKVGGKTGGFRITYSLPVAIAAFLVLLWSFRFELRLVEPQPNLNNEARAHAR